jgi:hypothetical protein
MVSPVPQQLLPFVPATRKVIRAVPTAEAVIIEATGRAPNARCWVFGVIQAIAKLAFSTLARSAAGSAPANCFDAKPVGVPI